jgi:two-component system, OmpR family, manganese sensing sensor histidine kinase
MVSVIDCVSCKFKMNYKNFTKTRKRLLLSYLGVLASVLTVFAIAVRIVYLRSLHDQIIESLTLLAQSVTSDFKLENGKFKLDNDGDIIIRNQTLEWFNQKQQLISTHGNLKVSLPLRINRRITEIQAGTPRIMVVTLPVLGKDSHHLLGYIRASQSLEEIDENLHKLDLGLGSGIIVALVLSTVGGIWLTKQSMKPIEESFAQFQQFTADASHELRNPLTAIKSNVAVALKYAEGMRASDAEKFEAIASATSQMTHLTEDLLLLARVDRLPERSHQSVNMSIILSKSILLYTPQAEAKQISIKSQLPESIYMIGDLNQLTRLFSNLLTNALRYTSEGGKVEVRLRTISKLIIVDIQDTGIGIAPEHLERIFNRFWQADRARSYEGGSGLGLAIAKAIAISHNGKITVKSKVNHGSCFTVLFSIS